MAETSKADGNVSFPVPITGRVAQIINARELVINVGTTSGVTKGMRFRVLADTPLEVLDPATKELLGTIDREKTQVEAVEVRERMSVCRTFRTIATPGIDLARLSAFARLGASESRPETLHLKDSSLPPPLPESESYVKTNDRVEQIVQA